MFKWNSIQFVPFALSLDAAEKSLALSSLLTPTKHLCTSLRSTETVLQTKLSKMADASRL